MMTWHYIAIPAAILMIGLIFLIVRAWRRPNPILPIQYSRKPPRSPYYLISTDDTEAFSYKNPYLDGQSEAWQQRMDEVGRRLDQHRVTHIYFVHGTWVGDDPFGLIPALRRIHPDMSQEREDKIREKIKSGYGHLTKDTGNYLEEYVDLFRLATSAKTQVKNLTWSSANHHLARLEGALALMQKLHQDLPDIPISRILLVGHSHGGGVFALFTHLINHTHLGQRLWDTLIKWERCSEEDRKKSLKLRKFFFDIATFGTPHRYPWRLSSKIRLVNVINHRGKTHLAEKPLGFWKTAGGDYVQQWGIAGSDSPAAGGLERKINRDLDSLLGLGIDPKGWLENVAKGMRVQEAGTTYLVDYKDHNVMVPNFMKTVFGHGIYTRYEMMLFNSELICKVFYS